jgi:hypothetical protein
MLTTVPGIYRAGRIELSEQPGDIAEESPVLVTFLGAGVVNLESRGISAEQVAELRGRLAAFEEEWNSPEMSAYDDYDAQRRQLESR